MLATESDGSGLVCSSTSHNNRYSQYGNTTFGVVGLTSVCKCTITCAWYGQSGGVLVPTSLWRPVGGGVGFVGVGLLVFVSIYWYHDDN